MRLPFNGNYNQTQEYGVNPAAYAKFGMKGHNGLDFGLPTGTPVLAPHDGKVWEITNDPAGYGIYIKVENNVEGSVLAHLKSTSVKVGEQVSEGQQIGISNNTGNSTGPHLHWGYYRIPRNRQNGFLGYVDQTPYLNSTPLPIPPITMTDIEKKKLVQFDRTVIELNKTGYISSAASEQFFDNPMDEDKFTNLIKRIIRDAKDGATPAEVGKAYEEGRKAGVKQIQDIVAKQV